MRTAFNPSPLIMKKPFLVYGLGWVLINSAMTITTTTTTFGARPV